MAEDKPKSGRRLRWHLDPLHMTLRRQSRLKPSTEFAIRMAIMIGMIVFIVVFHWIERDALKDQIDGHINFADVIYFTMISATTTGYGDIVPVTDRARLFDAVLLDLIMPRMDGYQVLAEMKQDARLRRIPVIIISSSDEIDSVVRCIEMGATDYRWPSPSTRCYFTPGSEPLWPACTKNEWPSYATGLLR